MHRRAILFACEAFKPKRTLHITTPRRSDDPLLDVLEQKIDAHRKKVAEFRKKHGNTKVGEIVVNQIYGGMRGIKSLVTETSFIDPNKGVVFRGKTIEECEKLLPKADGGTAPLPEGILWLLLTGDMPNAEQVEFVRQELVQRATVPDYIMTILEALPPNVQSMAQLSAAFTLCNTDSRYKAYCSSDHYNRAEAWRCLYQDLLDLIARLVPICSKIYNNTNDQRDLKFQIHEDFDWTKNFCYNICREDDAFIEMMRLYFVLHCDHEGGNVSAHAGHLVGSSLADPYLSFAAGMNGLAGPLHGLANQEVMAFIAQLIEKLGDSPTNDEMVKFVNDWLKKGKVVPGFGHAVLRVTDPRYMAQRRFAEKHLPNDKRIKIVRQLYDIVPKILGKLGKVQNPYPNVDAHSGSLLHAVGFTDMNFNTVLFGMSRAIGICSSLLWDRAIMQPIERPKSVTTDLLIKLAEESKKGTPPSKGSKSAKKKSKSQC